jgi:hypothetical protein
LALLNQQRRADISATTVIDVCLKEQTLHFAALGILLLFDAVER